MHGSTAQVTQTREDMVKSNVSPEDYAESVFRQMETFPVAPLTDQVHRWLFRCNRAGQARKALHGDRHCQWLVRVMPARAS